MCGIVGLVRVQPDPPVDPGVIDALCAAITHRGPDAQGTFVEGRVGLGMRRLSIIDLAGGDQPIFNEDESKLIVFNGEIYNYRGLRTELLSRGHAFRTNCDTETILHLYEEQGEQCAARLRGMFTFAIWDRSGQVLTLARDRFGIKPLYVMDAEWGLAFSSELKAFKAAGLEVGDLDWDAIDAYFRLGYIPSPMTPFRGVRKLEPGHVLRWTPESGARTSCYWSVPTRAARQRAHAGLSDDILAWLDESVDAHMIADVPVAAFLSGGLDSSSVVASMAETGHRPHAFTARYHGTGAEHADETPLAVALAERYGARLTIVDVEPDVRQIFEPIVRALDEPHADESAIPTWLLSEAVAAEYKVALAGTGGDELFAGYRRHLGLLASSYYGNLPGPVRRGVAAAIGRLPEPHGGGLTIHRLKRFAHSGGGSLADRYFDLMDKRPGDLTSPLLHEDVRAVTSTNPARANFNRLHEEGGSPRGLNAALHLDYRSYLPDDLLHIGDRLSMAHSLEVRVPYVDHELVEHVFPLTDRAKLGLGKPKFLLRRALRTRLLPQHFTAPKRGFVGPTAQWLRNEMREMLEDELSDARMRRLGFFDPGVVRQLLDDHRTRRHNREAVLWALLCFSTWHRLNVEGPA